MYRSLGMVAGLLALMCSAPAYAVVQDTKATVTAAPGSEVPTTQLKITQVNKDKTTKTTTAQTPRRNRPTTARVQVDPDKVEKIEVTYTYQGREEKKTFTVAEWMSGNALDLGNGLSVQNAVVPPTRAATRATPSRGALPRSDGPYAGPTLAPVMSSGSPISGVGVDVGFIAGYTNYNPSNGRVIGNDTLAATPIDQRSADLGGSSGTYGVIVNTWMPVSSVLPTGSNIFLQTGAQFPSDGARSARTNGINVVPQGTTSTTLENEYQIPLFAGFSVPLGSNTQTGFLTNWRWRVGGGGIFTKRNFEMTGNEVGAGAGSPGFRASQSITSFDPGFLLGFRTMTQGGGLILGVDVMVTYYDGQTITVRSPNFASQSYTASYDGGVNTSVMFSASVPLFRY